jgi:hypothetical protein
MEVPLIKPIAVRDIIPASLSFAALPQISFQVLGAHVTPRRPIRGTAKSESQHHDRL